MKTKLRAATKHFMGKNETGGVLVEARFCIEACFNRRWLLLGDEGGPFKFETRDERDAKLVELRTEIANSKPASAGEG
jgi:hypothetical protein